MSIESERRFLLANDNWRDLVWDSTNIKQGYLCDDPERIVRIRVSDNECFITIKGVKTNGSGLEFEYSISLPDSVKLLELCKQPIIKKTRYNVVFIDSDKSTQDWEIDVFGGDNTGLIIAELELEDISSDIELPSWLGLEITNDIKYANNNLATNPYKDWYHLF